MAKVIKVPPIKVGEDEYKVANIDLAKKTKIMNALIQTGGEPNFELFVKILQISGFKDDDILYMDIKTTTEIGNTIIASCNTKKKKKSSSA